MSKAFKSKTCVYCAAEAVSETGDHVFARQFFAMHQRSNLPKVPSCKACNNAKSMLEHYLASVLPFGNRLDGAGDMLGQMVAPRMERNQRLKQEIASGQTRVLQIENGTYRPTTAIPFESEKLTDYTKYVAKGLVAYHWKALVPGHYFVAAGMLTEAGEDFIAEFFRMSCKNRVSQSLGNVFRYEGVQAFGDPALTFWCFSLYGGAVFAESGASGHAASRIWAMTAPYALPGLFGNA
jgi:hypothetical protein